MSLNLIGLEFWNACAKKKNQKKKDPKMMVICHHATLRMLLWLHVYKGGFSSGFWRLFEKRTVLGVVSLISYDLYTDLNLRNGITTERVLRQLPDTIDVPYNALFPLSIIFDTTANWLCLEKKKLFMTIFHSPMISFCPNDNSSWVSSVCNLRS